MQHDHQDITASDDVYYIRWLDVLAVFSPYVSGSDQDYPVVLVAEQIDKLREPMWAMNAVDYSTQSFPHRTTNEECTSTTTAIPETHKTPVEMATTAPSPLARTITRSSYKSRSMKNYEWNCSAVNL